MKLQPFLCGVSRGGCDGQGTHPAVPHCLISAGLHCWATGCAGAAHKAACGGHGAGLSETVKPSLHPMASYKTACDHPSDAGKEGEHGMRRSSFGVFGESPHGANNIPPADWCCRGIKSSECGFSSNRRQSYVSVHRLKHSWIHSWAKEVGEGKTCLHKVQNGKQAL